MKRAMEHCDDTVMEHCDEKNSGALSCGPFLSLLSIFLTLSLSLSFSLPLFLFPSLSLSLSLPTYLRPSIPLSLFPSLPPSLSLSPPQALPCTCGMSHTRTMMLDGTYSEADTNSLAGYTRAPMVPEDPPEKPERMVVHLSLDSESTEIGRAHV